MYLYDFSITAVANHKHLGITYSNDGNWNEHIDIIISKTLCKLKILRKLKIPLDRTFLEKLYFTFIRRLLE